MTDREYMRLAADLHKLASYFEGHNVTDKATADMILDGLADLTATVNAAIRIRPDEDAT